MKICSYNLYGVINTPETVPTFQTRLGLLKHKIELMVDMIDIFFFQEVNVHNMSIINDVFKEGYIIYGKEYPMTTDENTLQYNIIVVKEKYLQYVEKIECLPHGKDAQYQVIEKQIRDYGMSDYRTSLFLHLNINGKHYVLGNTHTDYISINGKINGVCKSLSYLDKCNYDYALLLGDMNMVSHMAECYTILQKKINWTTVSKNPIYSPCPNSYHGYGINESVNVDFAFIPKKNFEKYGWDIIYEYSMEDEGSDHCPIIITIS